MGTKWGTKLARRRGLGPAREVSRFRRNPGFDDGGTWRGTSPPPLCRIRYLVSLVDLLPERDRRHRRRQDDALALAAVHQLNDTHAVLLLWRRNVGGLSPGSVRQLALTTRGVRNFPAFPQSTAISQVPGVASLAIIHRQLTRPRRAFFRVRPVALDGTPSYVMPIEQVTLAGATRTVSVTYPPAATGDVSVTTRRDAVAAAGSTSMAAKPTNARLLTSATP